MKQTIWSSDYLFDDKAREDYENSQRDILDDDDYEVSDAEWADVVIGTADGRATRYSDITSTASSTCRKMRTNGTVTASISVAASRTMTAHTMYFTVW